MTNEITRENVQSRMDRRAAAFKEHEAVLENQARLLRLIINDNHKLGAADRHDDGYAQVDEKTRIAMYAQSAQCPQNKAKAENVPDVKAEAVPMTRREQEAAYCNSWYQLILRIFAPLMVAALAMTLTVHAGLSFWVTIPILLVGITLSVLTVLVWGLFKWQEYHDLEQ